MKKKRITYGVSGMMQYQAIIKIGYQKKEVLFKDGSISAMGINPATYTTTSLIMQRAIETSNDFKRGLIIKVQEVELSEEVPIERNEPIKETVEEKPMENDTKTEVTQIKAECNDDAKDYLESHFGTVRSKLRTRADIISVAAQYGVEFVFPK